MKTIETLLSEITTNKTRVEDLQSSITTQVNHLMSNVSTELIKEGVSLEYRERHNTIEIPVNQWQSINIRFNTGGAYFMIDTPNTHKNVSASLQVKIYKVLSMFENELTDIQLDLIEQSNIERWETENELVNAITEDMFNHLSLTGELNLPYKKYTMTKGNRGRYNLTETASEDLGSWSLTRSYFKSQVIDELRYHARLKMNEMLNTTNN